MGRATDPSEEELLRAEAALAAADLSGWLAVMDGDYWTAGEVQLLLVRPSAEPPPDGWNAALAAFRALRVVALSG